MSGRRHAVHIRALRLCAGALLLAGCYDDTPMTLKIIEGESDRVLYAQTLLRAAADMLAPHSDLLFVSEQLSSDKGPLTMERVIALRAQVARDGRVTPLEEDILLLATAAAAAHTVYALTPQGAREAARHRDTHAIDEFQARCAEE